jgi:hypothetical protein
MGTHDLLLFIYVNVGFICLVIAAYYFQSVSSIKQNWGKYRCNPLYMPLSNNISSDFAYCIHNPSNLIST